MLTQESFLLHYCNVANVLFQELSGNLLIFDSNIKSAENILKALEKCVSEKVKFEKLSKECLFRLILTYSEGKNLFLT